MNAKLQFKRLILFSLLIFANFFVGLTVQAEEEPLKQATEKATGATGRSSGSPPANTTASPPIGTAPEQSMTEKWEQRAIDGNITVSRWFDGAAEFLDLFIAGRRVTNERNTTSARIENASIMKEGEGFKNSTAFNLNLRLPNVEEYWNLKFTSYDEERERRAGENAQYRQRPREQNYGASIGWFQKLGNVRTAFQPRVELQNPLKVSHSLAFETNVPLSDRAQMTPKLEFFAASDRGTGVFWQLNFGIQLNKTYSLSLVNQSTYEDKPHLYTVAQGIAISRQVTRNSGISYSLFFNSDNQMKYHLASYSFATTWSQVLYKNILEYNVTPYWDFPLYSSFTGRTGINFNINLKF